MDEAQIKAHLAEYAARYPSLLTVGQAAEIAQRPPKTIHHWSSIGLLDAFKSKRGKEIRLSRDPFVRFMCPSSDDSSR